MAARLGKVLAASPADDTQITWIESAGGEATTSRRRCSRSLPLRRVSVRVREGGRQGRYETDAGEVAELEDAVRLALAHSRIAEPLAPPAAAPDGADEELTPEVAGLCDEEVAGLTPGAAQRRVHALVGRQELASLRWREVRLVAADARGLMRRVRLTGLDLVVRAGRGPGVGTAAGAARGFDALGAEAVASRARELRWDGATDAEAAADDEPFLVLAPEAAADLAALLGQGLQPPTPGLGAPDGGPAVAGTPSPRLVLRDDPADPRGLPLPWDLAGRAAAAVDLADAGAFGSPPLPADLQPPHLLLLPAAGAAADDLLATVGDGLWIGRLERLAPVWPGSGDFRAVARGVRTIAGGRLGALLPPLVWEDRLARVFGEAQALGSALATRPLDEEMLGGVSAPALAVAPGGSLRPLSD